MVLWPYGKKGFKTPLLDETLKPYDMLQNETQ